MIEDDPPIGIPNWIVTYGDMMSLLLTFFIMLVSMSEVKQEEKYQAMVESMQRRFGYVLSKSSITPGQHKPRESELRVLSTMGRAKKQDTHKGGTPTVAPFGDNDRVRIVRPGGNTAIGTVVFFNDGEVELSADGKMALDFEVEQLVGKPQKIEIRGHTSKQLGKIGDDPTDAMDLSYRRCRAVMKYLVNEHQIPPERIRLAAAGAWEPMHLTDDPDKNRLNPRVEVFLLEETVEKLHSTSQVRESKIENSPEKAGK